MLNAPKKFLEELALLVISFFTTARRALTLLLTFPENPLDGLESTCKIIIICLALSLTLLTFCCSMEWLLQPRECRSCEGRTKFIRRKAQNELLERLMSSKTPNDLWYDLRILCIREGVKSSEIAMQWDRFLGLRKDNGTRTRAGMKRMWELGRASVLRELARNKVMKADWIDMLVVLREENAGFDEQGGKVPEYTD